MEKVWAVSTKERCFGGFSRLTSQGLPRGLGKSSGSKTREGSSVGTRDLGTGQMLGPSPLWTPCLWLQQHQLWIGQQPPSATPHLVLTNAHLCFRGPRNSWEGGGAEAAGGDSAGLGRLPGQEPCQVQRHLPHKGEYCKDPGKPLSQLWLLAPPCSSKISQ